MNRVRIVFPEIENEIISQAIAKSSGIEAVPASNLEEATTLVASGAADGLIAGIDYTSREVILACRDGLGTVSSTFSASFVLSKNDQTFVIGDAAACKNPTAEQLYDITLQTYATASAVLSTTPKIALLSFSTLGSGGHDPSIDRARSVVARVRQSHPAIDIDGELQLDAALDPAIAAKKAPGSAVAGRANVFILPDLNSGNILYKAMERFGGFTAAGPILQGFRAPCSDLSRGSTVADVCAVINVVQQQILQKGATHD